jgi:hypothetical protein
MKIFLRPFSILQNYFKGSRIEISCPSETTFSQLCEIVDISWGNCLPPDLWNSKSKRFSDKVIVMIGSKDLSQGEDPVLTEGQEVFLLLPFAGG